MKNKVVLTFCFILFLSCTSSGAIDITIQPDLLSESCATPDNGTSVLCPNLDLANHYVHTISNGGTILTGSSNYVSIALPGGTHYITTQTYFGNASVSFAGLDSGTEIVCDFYADEDVVEPVETSTWYFNGSEEVKMANLHFKNCGFPFRLFAVRNVIIENCIFM